MPLSALAFQQQFRRFENQVRQSSGGQPFTSFGEGLPAQWEDYKGRLRMEALRLLGWRKWKRADVGKGRILERVIRAIEIHDAARDLRNNLVAWPNRYGHTKRPHRALLDAKHDVSARRGLERWFLDFFQGRLHEPEAFETFRQLARDRYDLIAYLFFLKDWNRFMPIAPVTFDKAFRLLGVDLVTARHCSWANYASYNEALLAIQRLLRDVAGVTDVRPIDAHSFCWMLVWLPTSSSPPAVVIPLPKDLEALSDATVESQLSTSETEFTAVDEEQFVQRDADRRRLGQLAQDIALQSEWKRLRRAGLSTPGEWAKPVWNEPARGYDILSREIDGTPRHIEVKAARRSGQEFSFFLTRNEWRQSRSLPNYHFYLVVNTQSNNPTVLTFRSEAVSADCLVPINYLASLRAAVR